MNYITAFSELEKEIEEIWSWYEDQLTALRRYKLHILNLLTHSVSEKIEDKFLGYNHQDIEEYFNKSEEELQHLVCFDLISATEAKLRVNTLQKIRKKDKSPLGRTFRALSKEKGDRISLEDDILENWKKEHMQYKNDFSEFIGLLKYRHWLAHGRYWNPKLGRIYDPYIVYGISERIFEIVSSN